MVAQQIPAAGSPSLEIAYCGERAQKPPLKTLFFNITLHNRADHARWFLLPRSLYEQPVTLPKQSLDVLEVRTAVPANHLFLVDFMGSMQLQPESAGGFQGFLLPAGATLTARSFTIALWGETEKPLPVRLVITDSFTMAGAPAAQYIRVPVLSDTTTDFDLDQMSPGTAQARIGDLIDVPVEIKPAEELIIPNALAARCAEQKKPLVETPMARLMHARNVMVVRSRGSVIPYDVIVSTLDGWGRFTLVNQPDQADLVIQVATTGGEGDFRISSSTGPSIESGRLDTSTHTSKDLSSSEVSLTVVDARNKRVLFTATETAKYAMKQTARENNLVEAAEKLASKLHDRLEPPPAARN
jgi:hypothetical protein